MLTATDDLTQLDISELVDMESEPGCEHPAHERGIWGHAGPAWAVVRRIPHCACPKPSTILICKGAWDRAGLYGLKCHECDGPAYPRDEAWQLVEIL